jgi:hypothetical protein
VTLGELDPKLAVTSYWLLILVTLMMEALDSSETSAPTRAKRHNNPGHGILHSHRRENLKSYMALTGLAL